jgi:hypothetical protein
MKPLGCDRTADGGGGAGHGREELETGTALSGWGQIQLSQEVWPNGHPDPDALTASSGLLPGAPTDQELTLGDAWLKVFQQALPRPTDRGLMDTPTTSSHQRVWVTTTKACAALGMSRETLRQLRLRGY